MASRSFAPRQISDEDLQTLLANAARIPEECHLALGLYMHEWSILEQATGRLAALIFGTEEFLGALMADRLQANSLRDILSLAASNYMNTIDYSEFKRLSSKWEEVSGVRNRIVHGQWRIDLVVAGEDYGQVSYTRFTHIWQHEKAIQGAFNTYQNYQSIRDKTEFKPEQIRVEADRARSLSVEINDFSQRCVMSRRSDRHPEQSAVSSREKISKDVSSFYPSLLTFQMR